MKPKQLVEHLHALRKAAFAKASSPNAWRRHEEVLDVLNSKKQKSKMACRKWKNEAE